MTSRISPVLDQFGRQITHANGKPRPQLSQAFIHNQRPVRARYDAAQTTDDNKNYWANADSYDADSANSRTVRSTLVTRARYEIGNNGYADGIAQTYATDLVGVGPRLRMQSGSPGFNAMVEFWWNQWVKQVQFRRKLWCQAHAKYQDGEGFGVVRRNPNINHPVPLDYVLYETEQFQTPALPWTEGYIDGIRFDQFGNPTAYDLLRYHPGATQYMPVLQEPEVVPARFVMHWFLLRRPGQHRAVPELSSTLNTGAAARRWREATLAAAETAADFSILLKTGFQPDEIDAVAPMSTLDIQKRMMTALPSGWDAAQMKAEHPNSTHTEFHRALINEQARPRSMPLNKASCDSSQYNYASGRLDHQTYYASLDVDREDGNDLVLDPLFSLWFDYAVTAMNWLGGDPMAITPAAKTHTWDWPKHQAADIQSEALANERRLKSGQVTLSRLYAEQGLDFEDELAAMARDYGVDDSTMRELLRNAVFNAANQQASMEMADAQQKVAMKPAATSSRPAAEDGDNADGEE